MQSEPEEQRRYGGERDVAALQDSLPRKAVGGLPRDQKQKDPGQKLRQTHQPQVQSPSGHGVDLPSHRHRLHFGGDGNQRARRHVVTEAGVLKRDAAGRTQRITLP